MCWQIAYMCIFYFNWYLAAPRPTLGHYRRDSLTRPMLITAFLHFQPEGQWEPRDEVGSLSPAERLVGFVPGTFRLLLQCLNPLGYSPRKYMAHTQNVRLYKFPYLIIFITIYTYSTTICMSGLYVYIYIYIYIYMFFISCLLFSILCLKSYCSLSK